MGKGSIRHSPHQCLTRLICLGQCRLFRRPDLILCMLALSKGFQSTKTCRIKFFKPYAVVLLRFDYRRTGMEARSSFWMITVVGWT